jgi:uncharacterized membrane protein YidH (DUF202 family)
LRVADTTVALVDQRPDTVSPPPTGGLPPGYREGFLTAITVMLGFSLALVRFWGLESSGPWTRAEIVSAAVVAVGTGFQMLALFRSLRVKDDDRRQYVWTVRYFVLGVLIVMVGVFAAILASAQAPDQPVGSGPTGCSSLAATVRSPCRA